ncbi:MAG: hypothetical protein GY854_29265, partial [Deltaproteobacteria bacterium]|nr:hypothetical protein [Deltaproteobacteria bacterium]
MPVKHLGLIPCSLILSLIQSCVHATDIEKPSTPDNNGAAISVSSEKQEAPGKNTSHISPDKTAAEPVEGTSKDTESTTLKNPFYPMLETKIYSPRVWFLGDNTLLSDDDGFLAILRDNRFVQITTPKSGAQYCSKMLPILFGKWPQSAWMIKNWTSEAFSQAPIGVLYEWRDLRWLKKMPISSADIHIKTWGDEDIYALALSETRPVNRRNSRIRWKFIKLRTPRGFVVPKPARSNVKRCGQKISDPSHLYISENGDIAVFGSYCNDDGEVPGIQYAIEKWRPGQKKGEIQQIPTEIGNVQQIEINSLGDILLVGNKKVDGIHRSLIWRYDG